jgi:transporter family-2 protein
MRGEKLTYPFAFASGGLLTLMVLFNGQWARDGTALFASWMAHGTGTVAALLFLAVLGRRGIGSTAKPKPPFWAYLGGLSGALTVMLTSSAVNSVLALSGTLALGLVGQAAFSLLADRFGWFGLPRRPIAARELLAFALVLLGGFVLIFAGGV